MKFAALFAVTLLLFVDLSLQIPLFVNCTPEMVNNSGMMNGCGVITCHGPDSITGVGCGTYQCAEGEQIGYREEDDSEPYPDCCGGPICAD